jgi:hypothetical protein
MSHLRDELDIRRRHVLDALDALLADRLYRRLGWQRREELVDEIESLLESSDADLILKLRQP